MTAAGLTPDPWQASLLRDHGRHTLLLCSRQAGKSETAAALALARALMIPGSVVLLLSPTERQSGELARKAWRCYEALKRPVAAQKWTELQLDLANGSRLIALPGIERTVRTYGGVTLLVIDEAARVPDELYKTVRPMLAVARGRLLALSTPFGRQGWFWEEWQKGGAAWDRVRVTADQCPRIPAAFLEEERRTLGELWFRQEYLCDFVALEGAEWPPAYFPDSVWFDDWPKDLACQVLALDPSKGKDARTGDYAAFARLGVDGRGVLYFEADLFRGKSAEYLAQQAVEHCRAWQPDVLGIESNQFLQLFAVLIQGEAEKRQVLVPIVELCNQVNKRVRIRRLGPYLFQGRVRFKKTPGTELLVRQLQEFPEGEHDDGPDAAEMAVRLAADLLAGRDSD